VILFAPAASLEAGLGPVAVLAPDSGACASPSLEHGLTPGRSELDTHERHRFAGREVLVVGGGPAAREALVETWARARYVGQSCRIVASDDCVVRSLRDSAALAGDPPTTSSRPGGWREATARAPRSHLSCSARCPPPSVRRRLLGACRWL